MTYKQWYNKYIEPKQVPTGKGNFKVDSKGCLVSTKIIPKDKHWSPSAKASPNEVILHYGVSGQHDYDLYDSNGFALKQIHCGDHGNRKNHPFMNNGAHVADWQWRNKNGKWERIRSKNRELTDNEKVLVYDSLKT